MMYLMHPKSRDIKNGLMEALEHTVATVFIVVTLVFLCVVLLVSGAWRRGYDPY